MKQLPYLKLLLVAAAIIILIVAGRRLGGELTSALNAISALGPAAPIAFIAIYILACVLFIPGSILTIGAGVIFGVVRGSIYVSIASTAGATAAFVIGRYFAREMVARRIAGNPRFRAIDDAVAREGWKIVILTRLSPVFPFNLLNYAYGLTRVRLRDYVIASWVGMMPGTVMFVYIGSLSGDLARAASGTAGQPSGKWVLNAIGFIATVAVAVYATRIGSRALKERT
ncbi:MAG: TVP38/TMEM64 family protein [Candidatus Binataceae bacterium]